jgi:hypothetical protein
MTKKDFQFIADTIKGMPSFTNSLRAARRSAALAFADSLATTNPRFDRARFLQATGTEPVADSRHDLYPDASHRNDCRFCDRMERDV